MRIISILFFLILLSASTMWAKNAEEPVKNPVLSGKDRVKLFAAGEKLLADSPYANLHWQYLGPTNISGRCTDVEAVTPRGDRYTIWVGSASGGVWKSTNEGTTFVPVFDKMPTSSVGDIAIDPQNPQTVWIGTGEANIFRSSNAGCGVFKTTDGGKTWQNMGLENTHTIPRIRVHPKNSQIVYVAAGGHEWTHNKERGLYKTIDGGKTWQRVLYVDDETGVNDLVLDPDNPDTVYCTTWQRTRLKWNDPRTYATHQNNGIWKSTNGGTIWTKINQGLPQAQFRGRIGIDIAASNTKVLYAYVDNYEIAQKAAAGDTDAYGRQKQDVIKGATIFRSDDGGTSWSQVSGLDQKMAAYMQRHSATYGWVFAQIRVDPQNENRIYTMGLFLNVSEDGGKTFRALRGMHLDHHGLWIDPASPNYLLNVQDGGLAISYDYGENWRTPIEELPLAQFYNIAYDMATPFNVFGSIQDHHSFYGPVDLSRSRNRIRPVPFTNTLGAEGSSHAIDPRDGKIFASTFYGALARQNFDGSNEKDLLPPTVPGEARLRGQWVAPTIISHHNPDVIYHGMQFLMISRDRGDSWEKISPDLTYNDPKKAGDINYQTLTAIAESPLRFGLLYVGTDDGHLWRSFDGGKKWDEIRSGSVPVRWVSRLEASAESLGTVYMTQTGRRDDDFQVYVWKSTDFGKTWTDISGNIPVGPVNVIREDPIDPKILYVGTDAGVYISKDGGKKWEVLGDLPFAYVHDLAIHPRENMIIIATHGRGIWVLDANPVNKPQNLSGQVQALVSLSPEQQALLTGKWTLQSDYGEMILTLDRQGHGVRGNLSTQMGDGSVSILSFDGKKLAFTVNFSMGERSMEIRSEAEIDGSKIKGTLSSRITGNTQFSGEKK